MPPKPAGNWARRIVRFFSGPILAALILVPYSLRAEVIPVRFPEGSVHGFLALSTMEGKRLGEGDLTQTVHGNRVTARLVYRFTDGSIDDESTLFSQERNFQLIRDRHIQKGPSFPHSMDVTIDVPAGEVTIRQEEKGQVVKEHLDLPPDLANGLVLTLLKNIRSKVGATQVSYLAAGSKPRIVQLSIAPQGQDTFYVAGAAYRGKLFVIKVELGGVSGVVAPLVGKKPADTKVWIVARNTPAFVAANQSLYPGGPVWRIEIASPVWPGESQKRLARDER